MHMADALVSPAVGGSLWIVSGGLIALSARRIGESLRGNLVPMMGVLGSFIFAAQMINFSIPVTGSSGHLGGGLLLTVLLGPYAAFVVMASVLTVQAFFFGDGGVLALGCNMFNLGFFPSFVAYPLLYRIIAGNRHGTRSAWVAAVTAATTGLLLGAACVALETAASGISDLPLGTFLLVMLSIHLPIGIVEGLATAVVVAFIARTRPETLLAHHATTPYATRPVMAGLAIAAVAIAGVGSWFASTRPDGLEWSIARVAGREQPAGANSATHTSLAKLQEKTVVLPDYGFKNDGANIETASDNKSLPQQWPQVSAGTSVSGIVGGLITLLVAAVAGFALTKRRTPA